MEVANPSSRPHPSRRSFPNLTHLSLAPLSSRFPIDEEGYEEDESNESAPRSSYIQGKSAPTTPGILAPGPSRRNRKPKKKAFAYESYSLSEAGPFERPLAKTKSTSALPTQQPRSASIVSGLGSPVARHPSQPSIQNNDEWLHRAGLTIASEMRESKGQSWLISRESSTSLVPQGEDAEIHRYRYEQHEEVYYDSNHASRKASRAASRAASRVNSPKSSRRGSRAGSTVQFVMPVDTRMPAVEGYFDDVAMEPDFVDKTEKEGITDDEEVAKLSKDQGFGLGTLVDRFVGWPLFNVDEDTEDEAVVEEEEDDSAGTREELQKRKAAQLKRRKEQLAKAASSSASATGQRKEFQRRGADDEGGWQDAAWLLSVASKVLL